MSLFRLAAAVLALATVPLAAQGPGKTVPLRFGWQPGMRVDVRMEQVRIRESAGRRDSVRMASTYRVEVAEHPEGVAVTYADMRWTELPDLAPEVGRMLQEMGRTSTGGRGRMVVTAEGDFVRVDGAEPLAAELRAALQPLLAQVEADRLDDLREMIGTMVSPETLEIQAADEWNALVGAWVEADLEVGRTYTTESSLDSPVFPGMEIPVTLELRLADWASCNKTEAHARVEPRCVELVMESTPDPRAVSRAVGEFLARAGVPEDQARDAVQQMGMVTRVAVVTEPGTLRPHRLRTRQVVTATDDTGEARQVQTRTYTYRYAP